MYKIAISIFVLTLISIACINAFRSSIYHSPIKTSLFRVSLFGFGKKKDDPKPEVESPQKKANPFQGYGRDIYKKTGEKKDILRVTKNILFPGIYQEYEDTKEVKATIVVGKTATTVFKGKEANLGSFNGKYNVVDESKVPVYGSGPVILEKLPPLAKPIGFVAPTPKKAVGFYSGVKCIPDVNKYPRPKKPIVIYDDEKSPSCKKVREACSMLDLIVEYRPCPGIVYGFIDKLKTVSLGKDDIPFMFDNNPSMLKPSLYGSTDIINHLFSTYGPGVDAIPSSLKGGASGSGVSSGKGSYNSKARNDNIFMKPIQLYGWEGASYVRPVREALNSLALAHIMINCAEGSSNRQSLEKMAGTFQVPYIIDPNTGIKMFESKEIVNYLLKTYCIN